MFDVAITSPTEIDHHDSSRKTTFNEIHQRTRFTFATQATCIISCKLQPCVLRPSDLYSTCKQLSWQFSYIARRDQSIDHIIPRQPAMSRTNVRGNRCKHGLSSPVLIYTLQYNCKQPSHLWLASVVTRWGPFVANEAIGKQYNITLLPNLWIQYVNRARTMVTWRP